MVTVTGHQETPSVALLHHCLLSSPLGPERNIMSVNNSDDLLKFLEIVTRIDSDNDLRRIPTMAFFLLFYVCIGVFLKDSVRHTDLNFSNVALFYTACLKKP